MSSEAGNSVATEVTLIENLSDRRGCERQKLNLARTFAFREPLTITSAGQDFYWHFEARPQLFPYLSLFSLSLSLSLCPNFTVPGMAEKGTSVESHTTSIFNSIFSRIYANELCCKACNAPTSLQCYSFSSLKYYSIISEIIGRYNIYIRHFT
jgi:hypothetical protein